MLKRCNTAHTTQVHKVSHFFFSGLRLLTGVRHRALHHSPGNALRGRTKLQPNKNAGKEKSSFSEITMRYHHAVRTAAEHCSLGIRMLGMQRFINSLQIGAKEIEIHPNASLFPSPCLLLSICLFLPLLNSHPVSPKNNYTTLST